MITTRLSVAALIAVTAASVVAAQQTPAPSPVSDQPPVTFRVEVNYVEVDAVVTDAQGNPVANLTSNDFEVLEDGRAQKVTAFSRVSIPIERTERPLFAGMPIEPDVQSNTATDGRLYLIVLDDLHVTFSNSPRVKAALRTFLDRYFGSNDLAAVVYTSGRGRDGQDFTNNPRLLQAAIDRFLGRSVPSMTSERFAGGMGQCSGSAPGVADPCEAERGYNARNAMTSLRRLADFMAGVRGRRKAMLLISEGVSYDTYDVFNNRSANTVVEELRDAVAAATRGNVAIYAVDPRGLSTFDGTAEIGGIPDERRNDSPAQGFQSELRLAQDSLRTIAAETGGFAALNRNDFASAFDRIVSENSSYYVLGYYPSNERRDGRFRRIEVRVKRPGLMVRSRRGYVAPRGRAPDNARTTTQPQALAASVNAALASPIPTGGIPITVFAAPFKGTAPNAAIALSVEVRTDAFQFQEANGTFNDRLELAFAATSHEGKEHGGGRHVVQLNLKPDTLERAKQSGFRVVTQTELPPGRYQLRVAAAEDGGKAGSVLYDLEVPDFYRAPLTMSGVAITSQLASQVPTVLPNNPLGDYLPGPPTTQREFARTDEIALFAEFYENAPGAPPHKLDITASVREEGGRVVLQNTEERSSTELRGSQGGYGFQWRVPLAGLTPGLYVVRLEGRSRSGDKDNVVGRDIQIRVR